MPLIVTTGQVAYACDTCLRSIRVAQNIYGLDTLYSCTITEKCRGQLHKIMQKSVANQVSAIPPEVTGLNDWTQKGLLYNFTQPITSTVWTINHNLNTKPIVEAYTTALVNKQTVYTQVPYKTLTLIDFNTVQLTFDNAISGVAQCIALASARTTNIATAAIPTTFQLSGDGSMSIATTDPLATTFSIVYNSTVPVTVTYTAVGPYSTSGVKSPWYVSPTNPPQPQPTIFVNGKTFYVKNFNLVTHPSAASAFQSGAIINGSTFYFQGVSSEINQNLILLANSPYTSYDRIFNQYIDIATISNTLPQIFYSQKNAIASNSIIKSTYPQILFVA